MRIQAVAKEQMAMYEKNAREMEEKIKRQREEMQKKAQIFLEKLADQEAKVHQIITQTRLCNIQQYFTAVEMLIFR